MSDKIKDYHKITSKELDSLRKDFINLFEDVKFPYSHKKVTFSKIKEFGEERISVYYRNREGYLRIDNGYYGEQPDGRNYYTILLVNPYFTNVHSAYARTEKITWDKDMLNDLAKNIIKAWNHAIEQNYQLYG